MLIDALRGLLLQRMAKNGCFQPFYLVFSHSTVITSLLMLQNVRYYHTEQCLQKWSAHRCLKWLIFARNGPKMANNGCFWQFRLDSSSSTVTTSVLMLQNVSYHHTEQQLQTWGAHRCLMELIIAKNGPKMAKNGCFWPFYLVFFYFTVTTSLQMLQNVSYHHTEQLLQTWSAHRCLMGLKIAKKWPKNGQNRPFLTN